jgi:ABC-type spermidine/putrescine transport system permease subunit I
MSISALEAAPARTVARPGANVAKIVSIGAPFLFFGLFFLGPLVYLVALSFWQVDNFQVVAKLTGANYADIFRNFVHGSNYGYSVLQTLYVAATTAVLAVLVCYPMALAIVFAIPPRLQRLVILLAVAPFWTSYILRVYSWQVLLAKRGIINSALAYLGVDAVRVNFIYTQIATRVGLIHYLAPILLVILYVSINNVDRTLIEAARQIGATRAQVLWRVILPLTRTGVVLSLSFSALVACGDVLSGSILGGGAGASLIGKLPLYAEMIIRAYTSSTNLPHTAAMAMVLVALMLAVLGLSYVVTERLRVKAA